jgi:hypothetical protein
LTVREWVLPAGEVGRVTGAEGGARWAVESMGPGVLLGARMWRVEPVCEMVLMACEAAELRRDSPKTGL